MGVEDHRKWNEEGVEVDLSSTHVFAARLDSIALNLEAASEIDRPEQWSKAHLL